MKPLGQSIALVTGANRGLGAEVTRQLLELGHVVVATARQFAGPVQQGPNSWTMVLDVTNADQVQAVKNFVISRFGRLDVLINNAAVYLDDPRRVSLTAAPSELNPNDFLSTLDVNVVGSYRLIHAFLPEMKRNNYGRVVNVSSGMGRIVEIEPSSPFYRTSKAAINFLTKVLSEEVSEYDIKINAVCPGWVRTDMGGPGAVRSVEEGAKGIVWAAMIPANGPNGILLRDGEPFGW